jgi:purine catabolism regulator
MLDSTATGAPGSRLTLQDLLGHEVLGLTLSDPVGHGALDRPIAGAHPIEIDTPSQWLAPNWIVLTTGVRLRNKPQAQRRLVRELADAGISGLGFAVGVVCKQTPAALRDEARAIGFPVFEIPFATPLREIVAFVNGSLLSEELFTLRRAASMQRFLLDALGDSTGDAELVSRLGSLLDSSVVLLGCDGQAVVTHGHPPGDELWASLRAIGALGGEFRNGPWLCRAVPVESQGVVTHWLVIATRRRSAFPSVASALQETAARLLAVVAYGQRAARAEESARRAALLDDLIAGTCRPAELSDRLRSFGFAAGAALQPYALGTTSGEPEPDLARVAADAARDACLPYLVTAVGNACVLLTEAVGIKGETLQSFAETLAAAAPQKTIGVGRPAHDVLDTPQRIREAIAALDYGRRQGDAASAWKFEDLDLVGLSLATDPGTEMTAKAVQMLAPLAANGQLLTTLVAYFRAELDVARAAQALHLHPNSLRYRLAQVEKILGQDLRHPATIANLVLALGHARLGAEATSGEHPDLAVVERPVALVS